jgi:hypothetical protein
MITYIVWYTHCANTYYGHVCSIVLEYQCIQQWNSVIIIIIIIIIIIDWTLLSYAVQNSKPSLSFKKQKYSRKPPKCSAVNEWRHVFTQR